MPIALVKGTVDEYASLVVRHPLLACFSCDFLAARYPTNEKIGLRVSFCHDGFDGSTDFFAWHARSASGRSDRSELGRHSSKSVPRRTGVGQLTKTLWS